MVKVKNKNKDFFHSLYGLSTIRSAEYLTERGGEKKKKKKMCIYRFSTGRAILLIFICWIIVTLVTLLYIDERTHNTPSDRTKYLKYTDYLQEPTSFSVNKGPEILSTLREVLLVLTKVANTLDEISNSAALVRKAHLHSLQENRNRIEGRNSVDNRNISLQPLAEKQEKSDEASREISSREISREFTSREIGLVEKFL